MFRALLRLFPTQYREDHGPELESVFEDMRAEWERERRGTDAQFWAALAWDVVTGALQEWAVVCRDAMRSAMAQTPGENLSALMGDIRFALRCLIRQPLYGTTIVVLMTVGVAGNAGMFRIFNGLFLRP
ncbi:hypothetical protein ACFL3S_08270, partial [Gemmatimonadota bacterium]